MQVFHIASGLPEPLLSSPPRLTYVLKGMRHSTPSGRRVRLLITPEILEAIQTRWSVRPVSFDRIMLWAAFCLAFFAFLWAGKFTCPSLASFDESIMLSVGDVDSHSHPSYILVWLKRSMNDSFAQGVTLYIGQSHKKLCAVSALLAYLAIRSPAHSLFLRMAEYCLGSGWSLSSQLHCRKSGLTSNYSRVTASILEQPLQWLRLGWAIPSYRH